MRPCRHTVLPVGENLKTGYCGWENTRDGRPVRYGNYPEIDPGPEDTYCSYGVAWANASNTPFRKYKCWVHEGGISTPFIVHWPTGLNERNGIRTQPAQLPDVMATILDVTGSTYPERIGDRQIQPHEGFSLRDAFDNKRHAREVLTWEHEGKCGIRKGKWKLVREYIGAYHIENYPELADRTPGEQPWELYDIGNDRAELHDLASKHPEIVEELDGKYRAWAERCSVRPWEEILQLRRTRQKG